MQSTAKYPQKFQENPLIPAFCKQVWCQFWGVSFQRKDPWLDLCGNHLPEALRPRALFEQPRISTCQVAVLKLNTFLMNCRGDDPCPSMFHFTSPEYPLSVVSSKNRSWVRHGTIFTCNSPAMSARTFIILFHSGFISFQGRLIIKNRWCC